jgi:D-tyrosyl-tRNA(Tyr) deacylase
MKLVIQRVTSSSVKNQENSEILGTIGKGLCVLIGIGEGDGDKEVAWAAKTIIETKFWPDVETNKPWKSTVKSLNLQVLLVSQFTLYGKIYKKGKLDFHNALSPGPAKEIYDKLIASVQNEIGIENTQQGLFGGDMEVSIVNDGPVTILTDSPEDKI